jgi:Fe-S cluster assembly iron-binding protein IscA|tara:strand:- start:244 stop:405 length:162 start_codon:yes stop_codon:yes gene_type:complete
LSLTLDGEKPGDATLVHEGKTVLVIDEDVSQSLSNKTLDVEDSEEGLQLTIKD